MIRALILTVAAAVTAAPAFATEPEGDWKTMFDGKSMAGWKANENPASWKVEDGTLVCHGERSHLFYVGDDQPFTDFEFQCEVKTTPGSNSGIYFHTRFQEDGWPRYGYECQVNITQSDPKKSGGLYAVVDVADPGLKDNEWYTTWIRVEGRRITIKVNDRTTVDYVEPEGKKAFSADFERRLGHGTFALQAHDPDSRVAYRNLKVRRLK